MKNRNFFKYVFWLISIMLFLFIGGICAIVAVQIQGDPDYPYFMTFYLVFALLFAIVLIGSIARYVYFDAKKRGMDPWMWTVIAVYVPNLIGLIIYLITRNNYNKNCFNCGKQIGNDYKVCPYCGIKLNLSCKNCGREVSRDWKICPHCKEELN